MPDEMQINRATLADVDALVALHKSSLPRDAFPLMAPSFLKRFYIATLQSGHQPVLVARKEGRVVGFAAFSYQPWQTSKLVRPHDWLCLFFKSLIRPDRLISSFLQRRKLAFEASANATELTFLVVDPGFRSAGVGAQLLEAMIHDSRQAGKTQINAKVSNHRLSEYFQRRYHAQVVSRFRFLGDQYTILRWGI